MDWSEAAQHAIFYAVEQNIWDDGQGSLVMIKHNLVQFAMSGEPGSFMLCTRAMVKGNVGGICRALNDQCTDWDFTFQADHMYVVVHKEGLSMDGMSLHDGGGVHMPEDPYDERPYFMHSKADVVAALDRLHARVLELERG